MLTILQPWQLRYFRDFQNSNRMISVASRQIGKSFIASFCTVYDCVMNGASWTLVSTGQRAADELFRKCVQMAKYYEAMTRGTRLHFSYSNNASEIRFSNGASICSCPNNPDGLRGKSSSLLFDEFAFIANAEECWQACIPFLTSPYGAEKKLQIISTPAGKSGMFYNLWQNSSFTKTRTTLVQAVQEGLKVDIEEIRKTVGDDDIFAQEYLCEFQDSSSALLDYDLLRKNTYLELPKDIVRRYVGIDVGRTSDKTSIAIICEAPGGKLYLDRVESMRNTEFSTQLNWILSVCRSCNVTYGYIDSTGIGAMLAEELHKQCRQVMPYVFNHNSKNEIWGNLRRQIGDGNVLLPNEEAIIKDLHKIQKRISSNGTVTYSAERDETGHADDATSIALGAYASTRPKKSAFAPISF